MSYFALIKADEKSADLYIFGDIVDPFWQGWGSDADVSGYSIVKELAALEDVHTIRVHINSYGGVVSEGLAIYNALQASAAKVTTYCEGFACSAAAIVFMAGSERYMRPASLLMIHNAWTYATGNADELRRAASDLEIISETAANVFKGKLSISDDELQAMLSVDTWIPPEDALNMGFATGIIAAPIQQKASACARRTVYQRVLRGGADQTVPPDDGSVPDVIPSPAPEQSGMKTFFNFKEAVT